MGLRNLGSIRGGESVAMIRATKCLRWMITAYFAVVMAAGTGLHLVPGCGHSLDGGCGCAAHCACPHGHSHEEEVAAAWSHSGESPFHSAADCPICRFVSTASQLVQAVVLELSLPLADRLPATLHSTLAIRIPRVFAARAPPAA